MAATELGGNPSMGTPSLSKTRGILVETMQLVEPTKEIPVPNHILDTKIYTKHGQNSVFQARPAVIHFAGFEPGQTVKQSLHLANISGDVQRMHIIPPQTKHFSIKYKKRDRLVPGLTLNCEVELIPDEWRYYYDCIRVHTPGEENLIIPLHAYPVMNTSEFPTQVDFLSVPLGQSRIKQFPLRCQAPIDFEFKLIYLQSHPSFTVSPMAGIVPANGEVDITVTFTPTEFHTACMKLELSISQFNSRPLICTVTGHSRPGLANEELEASQTEQTDQTLSSVLDPRCLTPLDRARKKRGLKKASTSQIEPQEIERNGVKFPMNLDTPFAMTQVLNQEPGKLRSRDVRQAVSSKMSSAAPTQQMKSAMFEMAVRRDVYEERQNQLRWQVKVGDLPMTPEKKLEVIRDRKEAMEIYKTKRGDPVVEDEYKRTRLIYEFRRTRRDFKNIAPDAARFDTYSNDMWSVRHSALRRFQQAARCVIIRLRSDKKITSLRQLVVDWHRKQLHSTVSAEEQEKLIEETELGQVVNSSHLTVDRVGTLTFPTYVPPNVKDDMAVDALGEVPCLPTQVEVKKKVTYHKLKVPQHYVLMGYEPHDVHTSSLNYVPPDLAQPLRTGAEDEIITLKQSKAVETERQMEELKVEEYTEEAEPKKEVQSDVIPIRPPAGLFKPTEHPPLHIFNPAPGLQVYQQPMPYSETSTDFHLCPLPRYVSSDKNNPHMSTQKAYMDREHVIRGVMGWKKFPSQGLTSLSNTATLTSVWVPRWTGSFVEDLLPDDVPPLQGGLCEEDRHSILDEEESGDVLTLTPEMVNAEFALVEPHPDSQEDKPRTEENFPFGNKMPSTNAPVGKNGPTPREKREQELEYFIKKKSNSLRKKVQERIDQLDRLKKDESLILK